MSVICCCVLREAGSLKYCCLHLLLQIVSFCGERTLSFLSSGMSIASW